jgi:outer membrane protein TolC
MKLLSLALALLVCGSNGRAAPSDPPVPHELTLQKCLELALVHNPQLRIASEQFLSAEGRAMRLHAILYPSVNAQIQQTFYSRATLPQLRLSRLTRQQAFLNYRQALIDIVFQVRQAFTTELGAWQRAELSRQLVEGREAAVKTAQQLFDAGRAQRSDILQLQVLAGLGQQNDTLAGLTRQQGALALQTVLGVELPDSVTFRGDLEQDRGPADLDVGKLSAQALRDRQDLKLLENAQLASTQQIEIDLRNAYPVAGFESNSAIQPHSFLPGSVSYDLDRNLDEPQTQRQPGNTQLPFSLYLTWTIFDGGNLAGVKAGDQAQIASQAVAIDALKRSIPGEVAAAAAQVLSERATLRLLDAQIPPADLRSEADTDYQAGRVRLLDKVNLETDIVRQQQLRLDSQIRLQLALAALDHALGRGLEAPSGASSP